MSEPVKSPEEFFEALERFGEEPTEENYRSFAAGDSAMYWTLSEHPEYRSLVVPERDGDGYELPPDEVDAAVKLIAEQTESYAKSLLLAEWILDSQCHGEHLLRRLDRIQMARRNLIEAWTGLGKSGEQHAVRNEEKLRDPFVD